MKAKRTLTYELNKTRMWTKNRVLNLIYPNPVLAFRTQILAAFAYTYFTWFPHAVEIVGVPALVTKRS